MTWTHTGIVEYPTPQTKRYTERLFRAHDGGMWIGEIHIYDENGFRVNELPGRLLLDTIREIPNGER